MKTLEQLRDEHNAAQAAYYASSPDGTLEGDIKHRQLMNAYDEAQRVFHAAIDAMKEASK